MTSAYRQRHSSAARPPRVGPPGSDSVPPRSPRGALLGAIVSARQGLSLRPPTTQAFVAKQTHLSLNGRKLRSLGTALTSAPKAQVMYLFDNELHSLAGLSTHGLTHLYLQNNQLVATVELGATLNTLTQLQKLYISGNRLADLMPLCGLLSLEELHAGSQRGGGELVLPPDLDRLGRSAPASASAPASVPAPASAPASASARASAPSLDRLGGLLLTATYLPSSIYYRLRVLSLPHNKLCDVTSLGGCRRLESLDLSANSGITDMSDLAILLGSAVELHTLDLRRCPVADQRQMMDAVVVCGATLTKLNGREVGAS